MMFRQGDVLLVSVEKSHNHGKRTALPRDAKGRLVLAEGEVTGHFHAIADPESELYTFPGSADVYLDVNPKSVNLSHEEHNTIAVPQGTYRVVLQREYSPGPVREQRVRD